MPVATHLAPSFQHVLIMGRLFVSSKLEGDRIAICASVNDLRPSRLRLLGTGSLPFGLQ